MQGRIFRPRRDLKLRGVRASSIPLSKRSARCAKTIQIKALGAWNRQSYRVDGLDCRVNTAKVLRCLAKSRVACSNSAIPFQTGDKTLRCHSDLEANTSGCRKLTKLEPLESPHAHCGLGVDVWHLRPHQKISADEGRFDGLSSKSRNDAQRQRHTEARLS